MQLWRGVGIRSEKAHEGYTKNAVLALLVTACGLSSGPSDGPEEVALALGEEVAVPGSVLRVGFFALEEDSRCPTGVVCVWEGNAAVQIGLTAGSGPTQPYVLNTALEPRSVDFGRLRVTLLAVEPWPVDGQPTDPQDYVATLRLESLEP